MNHTTIRSWTWWLSLEIFNPYQDQAKLKFLIIIKCFWVQELLIYLNVRFCNPKIVLNNSFLVDSTKNVKALVWKLFSSPGLSTLKLYFIILDYCHAMSIPWSHIFLANFILNESSVDWKSSSWDDQRNPLFNAEIKNIKIVKHNSPLRDLPSVNHHYSV